MFHYHSRAPHRFIVFFILVIIVSCKKTEEPILSSSLNAIQSPIRYRDSVFSDTSMYSDLVYRVASNYHGDESLALDVYLPKDDTATKRAVVIFMHGGGWARNHPEYNRKDPDVIFVCQQLAKKGYIVVSPSYRTGIDWKIGQTRVDSLNNFYETLYRGAQDARACIRWVKSVSLVGKIDTNRIFIGGESAGAVNALNALYLDASEIPVSFVAKWGQLDGTNGFDYPGYSTNVRGGINVEGVILDTAYIDAGSPPVVSFYDTADPFYFDQIVDVNLDSTVSLFVSYNNGISIHSRTGSLGISTTPITVFQGGGGHGSSFNLVANKVVTLNVMANWMYSLLQ